jgi:pyridoxamine 5'-phosphate oxidase
MQEEAIEKSLADQRRDYQGKELSENSVLKNPLAQFDVWYNEAMKCNIPDTNAMTLATCGKNGWPSARIVLLKGYSDHGFTFFTNYDSHKGRQLAENPHAALLFYWQCLDREVRIEGRVERVSALESDTYFHSRPHLSQVAAAASPQSLPIAEQALKERFHTLQAEYENQQVTRPANWGGYILIPEMIEFWQGRPNRLHDRIQFCRVQGGWKIERLAP